MARDVIIEKKNELEITLKCEQHILYELQEAFSFDVEGASFSPAYRKKYWDGKIRLLNMSHQTLPAGLTYQLCKWCDRHSYSWDFKNNSYYGLPYEQDNKIFYDGVELFMNKIASVSPRKYQVDTVFNALKEYRKTIVSPTGSGKSLMIYSIVRYLKSIDKRTLIVVPSKSLVEQMYKDFIDYGWDPSYIHKIYGGLEKNSEAYVTITTWQSVYGLDKFYFRQFDALIGDECHNFKAKSLQGIMKKCPDVKWRYGFTGTLDGKQVHKLILEGLFGPVYNTTSSADLMEKGFLAQLSVDICILKHEHKKFDTYADEIEHLGLCEYRNQFISNLACDLKGNVLVLFAWVEKHGLPLHEMVKMNAGDQKVHLIYGDTHVKEREKVREICETSDNNIIVASYGTMSTGVNIKNLHHIVFASPSKSKVRVLQSIGRSLRKAKGKDTAKLWDIADDFRKNGGRENFTLKHCAERISYYVEQGFIYRITTIPVGMKSQGMGELPI